MGASGELQNQSWACFENGDPETLLQGPDTQSRGSKLEGTHLFSGGGFEFFGPPRSKAQGSCFEYVCLIGVLLSNVDRCWKVIGRALGAKLD